jgi:DNA-directed RNA polymerase subunit N (RpoN/RPB10)
MIDQRKQTHGGVICVHCGMHISQPSFTNGSSLATSEATDRHTSVVRCHSCGKEALYLASDIIVIAEVYHVTGIAA